MSAVCFICHEDTGGAGIDFVNGVPIFTSTFAQHDLTILLAEKGQFPFPQSALSSFKFNKELAFGDELILHHVNGLYCCGAGAEDFIFHLHGFQNEEFLFRTDMLAFVNVNLFNDARDNTEYFFGIDGSVRLTALKFFCDRRFVQCIVDND
jgi:hypothetical protein